MFGLNPFELAMILVFTILALGGTYRFVLSTSGHKRLFIYGLVLLVSAAVFLDLVESKTGTPFAREEHRHVSR